MDENNIYAYDPNLKINNYIIQENADGYVTGYAAVGSSEYDYVGQMSLYPEVCEGWYKYVLASPETKQADFNTLHKDYAFLQETAWVENTELVRQKLAELIQQWMAEGKTQEEIEALTEEFWADINATLLQRSEAKTEIEEINEKFQFVVDEDKKAEIIAEREAEARKPSAQDQLEAQVLWTALITDTLLPEEE